MELKRSQQKRISIQAKVLRHFRISKGLSLRDAAALVSISGPAISHIEQGRMDVSLRRTRTLVEAYGFTWDEFMEFVDGKAIPINYRDECARLLAGIDKGKLQTIYQVLLSFGSGTTVR